MSPRDSLLRKLCPNGVEHKPLGDVFHRLRGTPITARQMQEIANALGDITVFAGGKTKIKTFEAAIPRANITRVPAVLIQSRGIIDVIYCETPFTFKNEMWAYAHERTTTTKFLYYFLKGKVPVLRKAGGEMGSMPQIAISDTENIDIPLPPLAVQEEIVRRLDVMQEIVEALESELALRRKQYEAVRERLIDDAAAGAECKTIEDCCKVLTAKIKLP